MGPVVLPEVKTERSSFMQGSSKELETGEHNELIVGFEDEVKDHSPGLLGLALDLTHLGLGHFPALSPKREPAAGPGESRDDEELTNLDWLHGGRDVLGSLKLGGQAGLRAVSPPPVPPPPPDSLPSPAPSDDLPPREGDAHAGLPGTPSSHRSTTTAAGHNPNAKPPYSFSCLIFLSIEASPYKRLPVKGIYDWILDHFPYFVGAPSGWKNSVRHNLSLNKCFKKVDKDRHQSLGKGSLWCVDPDYRPNLIQTLKKAPYHPYSHILNTPPASPDSAQSSSLSVCGRLRHNGSALQESDIDAVTAMMLLNSPPEQRPAEYARLQQNGGGGGGSWGLLKPLQIHTTGCTREREGRKRTRARHDSEHSCGSPVVSCDPSEDHNYVVASGVVGSSGHAPLVPSPSTCSSCSPASFQGPYDLSIRGGRTAAHARGKGKQGLPLGLQGEEKEDVAVERSEEGKQGEGGGGGKESALRRQNHQAGKSEKSQEKRKRKFGVSLGSSVAAPKTDKWQRVLGRGGWDTLGKRMFRASEEPPRSSSRKSGAGRVLDDKDEEDEELKAAAGSLLHLAGLHQCLESTATAVVTKAAPAPDRGSRRKK